MGFFKNPIHIADNEEISVIGMGQVDTTPVLDPDQLTANQLGLLRGLLKQLQDGTMKTEINGSLPNQTLAEQLNETHANLGVLTFSENINCVEIYNRDAVNDGAFNVNGIDVLVPKGEPVTYVVGGIPSSEITVTGATSYIVSRMV